MIQVNEITKKYGRKKVLNGVSFTAEKGKITCLIGINGVGKSTVMRAIMGLTPFNSGSILIDDKPIHHEIYEKVAFIPDTITMPANMLAKHCVS